MFVLENHSKSYSVQYANECLNEPDMVEGYTCIVRRKELGLGAYCLYLIPDSHICLSMCSKANQ